MTEKIKSKEKKSHPQSNRNFSRNFALTLGFILVAIVFLVKYNPQLLDGFLKQKSLPINHLGEQIDKENSASEESYSVGPEPPLLSFSPEGSEVVLDEEDRQTEEDVESEEPHPYEIEVERDEFAKQNANSSEKQAKLVSVLNNYRLFLANADELIAKFRQDKVFYNELKVFNSSFHPEKIKNTLFLLEEYNKMLSNMECVATDKFVKIFSSKPWNKFIKITKICKASEDRKQLKDKINKDLAEFINYIYSLELQESFIK
ncbi:MAG: hypothetical protein K9G65_01720 [Rickettsiaceae bacterium]|jgi:hypothetical protein|nr:hypothetical protein [Rickettsiaceae bacterium]